MRAESAAAGMTFEMLDAVRRGFSDPPTDAERAFDNFQLEIIIRRLDRALGRSLKTAKHRRCRRLDLKRDRRARA